MAPKIKFIKPNIYYALRTLLPSLFVLFILLYIIIYWFFILPIFTIHELQTKSWITELTEDIVLGVNDRSRFQKINRRCDNLSFWYCYWYFHTKRYTGWILFNLQNKFSDTIMLNVYIYDFNSKKTTLEQVPLKFSTLKTEKIDNKLIISCKKNYIQEIDFQNNTSNIIINTKGIYISLDLFIDDYTTNMASFLPRYQLLNHIFNIEGSVTETPGDWMSDNPFIGKIKGGRIQNDTIEQGGNFWFDNFIGCNNNYLGPYTWFVVMNDDWLIYLLWYYNYEDRNKIGTAKPILIKDRKTDTFLYSGTPGVECNKVSPPFDALIYSLEPLSMTYDSKKPMGVADYDDYTVTFKSSKININISSIKGQCSQVFKYHYYKNEETNAMKPSMNSWDQKYYNVLSNIIYVEYVNIVNVNIEYNGATENFEARQIVDSMYPDDVTIPTKINYEFGKK
jgi:hypothetical protein